MTNHDHNNGHPDADDLKAQSRPSYLHEAPSQREKANAPGGVLAPTDAGYLRWVRLDANDTQLLGLRDANRGIPQLEQGMGELQEQYMTLLRIVAYLIDQYAGEAKSEYPVTVEVRRDDLGGMSGLNLDGREHEDGGGWTFQLAPSDNRSEGE